MIRAHLAGTHPDDPPRCRTGEVQDYLSRLRTVGGSVFIPWMVFLQLSFLFWGWFWTVLVYSLYGRWPARSSASSPSWGPFVVQGWTGDMAAGVEWAGPTGIMTAWRRSLVTITATGLATLKVGELTQMLVSGGGNIGSGASTRAVQTAAVARVAVTGGV